MTTDLVTTETIINYLQTSVETKQPISPSTFLDAAMKLNILLSEEHDKLFELQQKVAQARVDMLHEDDKRNVSKAKLYIEASDDYREMLTQKAKIDRIEEFIRLSKVQARMKDNEYRT